MKRLVLTVLFSAGLMLVTTAAALADPPGTNFPEQPDGNVANACANVLANPGSGTGGAAGQNASPTALAITGAIVVDACFGGP
jgi:hypothetical protein